MDLRRDRCAPAAIILCSTGVKCGLMGMRASRDVTWGSHRSFQAGHKSVRNRHQDPNTSTYLTACEGQDDFELEFPLWCSTSVVGGCGRSDNLQRCGSLDAGSRGGNILSGASSWGAPEAELIALRAFRGTCGCGSWFPEGRTYLSCHDS